VLAAWWEEEGVAAYSNEIREGLVIFIVLVPWSHGPQPDLIPDIGV